MSVCRDFSAIFSNRPTTKSNCAEAVIIESDSSAQFKQVKWINSDFEIINTKILDDMKKFFEKSSSESFLRLNCDGVMIVEKNGCKYMLFSELKSRFVLEKIDHARQQIISSYIKMNWMMNLLPSYNKQDYIIKGFIFSYPHNSNDIWDWQKIKESESYQKVHDPDFIYNLCIQKKTVIQRPDTCVELDGLPLHNERALFEQIEFHHIIVPENQSSIVLDVQNYI